LFICCPFLYGNQRNRFTRVARKPAASFYAWRRCLREARCFYVAANRHEMPERVRCGADAAQYAKYISICHPPARAMPALQTAFHLAPLGLVLSRDRVIEDCNDALAIDLRCARADLIGKSYEVLYPSPDEFQRIGERIARVMAANGIATATTES
jgi:hypothetical protein